MCILVIAHHAHICMSIGYCMSTLCQIHTRMDMFFKTKFWIWLHAYPSTIWVHIWNFLMYIWATLVRTVSPLPHLILWLVIYLCWVYNNPLCFMRGKALPHGWGMFPKWWTELDHHLVIGPLFWKCFTPWALTPHLYSMQDFLSFPPSQSVLVFDKGAACRISSLVEQDFNP